MQDSSSTRPKRRRALTLRGIVAAATLVGAALLCPESRSARAADTTFVVNSTADDDSNGTLRWAIGQANAAGSGVQTIRLQLPPGSTINLGSDLPMLNNSSGSILIENVSSGAVTIDGQNSHQIFFVAAGSVSISDMAIVNGASQGGTGGGGKGGGGGALGAGGALFVNTGASVTVENVQFSGNNATGGTGGQSDENASGGGGGAGFTSNGGAGTTGNGGGGGGGFAGDGAAGGDLGGGGGGGIFGAGGPAANGGGGGGGITAGNSATDNGGNGSAGALGGDVGTSSSTSAPAGDGGNGQSGATGGGGGGGGQGGTNTGSGTGGNGGNGGSGGFGGGGGGGGGAGVGSNPTDNVNAGSGGDGGTFAGGGGGGGGLFGDSCGGTGGDFGGGGGAGAFEYVTGPGVGGNGGFGGGGGGASASGGERGQGGFGGGDGGSRFYGGDGGDGLGGAIFVRQGGTLTVVGSDTVNNSVTAGAGGTGGSHGHAGQAAGQDLYLMSGVNATFGQTGSTFTGSISGEGGILVQGSQTTILTGENNYTGGTTVSGNATLQGTTTSIQGAITNNATVTFNQATDGTYSGNMTGSGNLSLVGAGVVTFSGQSTVSSTDVQSGGLFVNGVLTSDVAIGGGSMLGGSGTIHGGVTVDGNTAPGNSIGTLSVDGAYTQNAGSTLTIEINDAGNTPGVNNDLLVVDGATLNGGTVVVEAAPGNYSGAPYRFLRSETAIQGQFAGITDNLSDYEILLIYDEYDDYFWAYFALQPLDPDYAQFAATPNELAVANYLDSIYHNPDPALEEIFIGLNTLYHNAPALQSVFNVMSDQVSPTMAQVGIQNTTLVVQQLAGQLRSGRFLTEPAYAKAGAAPVAQSRSPIMLVSYDKRSATPQVTFVSQEDCDCWQGWSFGYGLGGSAQTDGNAAGLNYGMGGMLLGAERYFDRAGRIGFFGGYQGTSLQLDGLAQSGRINGGMFGGYFHNDDGFNYYTAITGMQFNGYDTTRFIQFDGISETANGSFSGWQGYGYLERGVSFRRNTATLQPYAALQYIYLRQNNYTETGAGVLNLDVSGIDANSLRSLVGGRLQLDRGWQGGRLLPEVRALWLHEFLDTDSVVNSFFAPIGGGSFAIQGLNLGRDWAIVGGGLRYELASGWQLYGNYDAQVNAQQVFHVGSGGLQYAW